MSEANNYVCFNVDQSGNHSEPTRLRARNNIGAAGLSSLAAAFESRAPSYNWSAGEVCTYGGALWMFDANHSGSWTGADAHVTNISDNIVHAQADFSETNPLDPSYIRNKPPTLYDNILDYADDWEDISSEFSLDSDWNIFTSNDSLGSISDIKAKLSRSKGILFFDSDARVVKNSTFDSGWQHGLLYVGNSLYSSSDNHQWRLTTFQKPLNVNVGLQFFMYGTKTGPSSMVSGNGFGTIADVGPWPPNNYSSVAFKLFYNGGATPSAYYLTNLTFLVDVKP